MNPKYPFNLVPRVYFSRIGFGSHSKQAIHLAQPFPLAELPVNLYLLFSTLFSDFSNFYVSLIISVIIHLSFETMFL